MVAFFMAQKKDTYAIIDNFNGYLVPPIDDHGHDIVAKATVNPDIPIQEHVWQFKPDLKILVLRNPMVNYVRLMDKPYGTDIDRKFAVIEEMYVRRHYFDVVIAYEDLVFRPDKVIAQLRDAGMTIDDDFIKFERSWEEMKAFNNTNWQLLGRWYGFGNIKEPRINPEFADYDVPCEIQDKVRGLCPLLCEFPGGRIPVQ